MANEEAAIILWRYMQKLLEGYRTLAVVNLRSPSATSNQKFNSKSWHQ